MGKCEKLWVNNGLKESWFHKIISFPFTGIRCQENGERGALVLAPSSTSWSLVRKAIAGWAAGPAQPAYPYPDLPSVSLAGPPRQGRPCFWPHNTPTFSPHPLHRWGACVPEFTPDGISSYIGTFPPQQPSRCPEARVGREQSLGS